MRRIVIPALTLLIGCATGVAVREVVAPARAQGQAGPSYEYEAVPVQINERKDVLTRFGNEGWRLAAVSHGTSVHGDHDVLYFERQKAR